MGRRPGRGTHRRAREGSGGKLTAALLWSLAHYDEWKAAKEKADAEGTEIPEAFEPPEILDGFGGWYEDFWRLSTERQIGFGAGAIPASAIDRHVAGWRYDDVEMFEHCIREMDGVYMKRLNKTEDAPPAASPQDAFRSATSGRRGR